MKPEDLNSSSNLDTNDRNDTNIKSLERKNIDIINNIDEVEKAICGIELLSINDIADRSNNNELMDTNYSNNRDLEEDYSNHSSANEDWSDHEECLESEYQPQTATAGDSSEEDWDSDSYWEPQYVRRHTTFIESPWVYYIKKKMSEGNFCPMDLHTVPVIEQVKYLKKINPRSPGFVEGQFDDLSDDES